VGTEDENGGDENINLKGCALAVRWVWQFGLSLRVFLSLFVLHDSFLWLAYLRSTTELDGGMRRAESTKANIKFVYQVQFWSNIFIYLRCPPTNKDSEIPHTAPIEEHKALVSQRNDAR